MSKDKPNVNVCDDSQEETYALDFSNEIDTIAQQFPESKTFEIPEIDLGFLGKIGGTKTTVKIRDRVKDLLNTVPSPSLEVTFDLEGNCDDFEAMTIECTRDKVVNGSGGGAAVVNVGVDYDFTADVLPKRLRVEECTCKGGAKGKIKTRKFHVKWYLELSINPGIRGSWLIDDFYVKVLGCCCCPDQEEDDGEDGEHDGNGEDEGHNGDGSEGTNSAKEQKQRKKNKKPQKPKGKPKRIRQSFG